MTNILENVKKGKSDVKCLKIISFKYFYLGRILITKTYNNDISKTLESLLKKIFNEQFYLFIFL